MRVKMIKVECGPSGNFQPGDERAVSAEQGRQLIDAGAAFALVVEQAVVSAPEAAVLVAPQTAIHAPIETRKKGRK